MTSPAPEKEYYDGPLGDNVLIGDSGNNEIRAGRDIDIIDGLEGNDIITSLYGDDTIYGGLGDDTIYADNIKSFFARWFSGDDHVLAGAGNDTVYGGGGDDLLKGNAGNDTIYGGTGNDVINGGSEDDTLYGEDGDDRLHGGPGNDILIGGDGNDILQGGFDGNDQYYGGAGNDSVATSFSADFSLIDTGTGNDTIWLHDFDAEVTLGEGADILTIRGEGSGDVTITDFNPDEGDELHLEFSYIPAEPTEAEISYSYAGVTLHWEDWNVTVKGQSYDDIADAIFGDAIFTA